VSKTEPLDVLERRNFISVGGFSHVDNEIQMIQLYPDSIILGPFTSPLEVI